MLRVREDGEERRRTGRRWVELRRDGTCEEVVIEDDGQGVQYGSICFLFIVSCSLSRTNIKV
jgi:hypothetical protein